MTLTEPRFVCDETGNKVAVVLPINLYEELVELLEALPRARWRDRW